MINFVYIHQTSRPNASDDYHIINSRELVYLQHHFSGHIYRIEYDNQKLTPSTMEVGMRVIHFELDHKNREEIYSWKYPVETVEDIVMQQEKIANGKPFWVPVDNNFVAGQRIGENGRHNFYTFDSVNAYQVSKIDHISSGVELANHTGNFD